MGLGLGLGLGLDTRQQRAATGEVEAQCARRAHEALHVRAHLVRVRGVRVRVRGVRVRVRVRVSVRTCWCVGLGLGLGLESGFRAHVLVRGEAERQRVDLVVACSRHQVLRKGPCGACGVGRT